MIFGIKHVAPTSPRTHQDYSQGSQNPATLTIEAKLLLLVEDGYEVITHN